jgi:hypothetical protein
MKKQPQPLTPPEDEVLRRMLNSPPKRREEKPVKPRPEKKR